MKIIAVMNQKGGIGKTMTAASIAYILSEEHKKNVLVADADQQGNISLLYGRYDPEGQGMPELLENHRAAGGTYSTAELIQSTPYEHIDIIPANGYLMRTNMRLLMEEGGDQILRFSAAVNEARTVYDYCIVDCGLLMDMTVTNVLAAADLVIAPVKIGGFEIEAADNMNTQIDSLRSVNPDIRMKVLLTMRQGNRTTAQIEEWLRESSGHDCFATAVRRSIMAEKSTVAHLPLPAFAKHSPVTQDYRAVVDEIIKNTQED